MNKPITIQGDLFDSKEQYIVHQCNCKSTGDAAGLAASIFEKYPEANVYLNRQTPSDPGTIEVWGKVIALYGQKYPGRASQGYDTAMNREAWFINGLQRISEIPDIRSIAFPFNIGCGLAGGNWKEYKTMISDFAKDNPSVKVVIYQLSQTQR